MSAADLPWSALRVEKALSSVLGSEVSIAVADLQDGGFEIVAEASDIRHLHRRIEGMMKLLMPSTKVSIKTMKR
jgi:hypothetical protein